MPTIEIAFEVERNYDGWRLDRYLQQKIARLSRAQIQKLIRTRLRSDAGELKPSSLVRPGLRFVLLKDVDDERESAATEPIRVLHDDDALLVLDKPSGIAVHPSARYFKHTVTTWLGEHALNPDGTRPNLGHRLDRETSGVLACGRTYEATKALKAAFAQRRTEKAYLALCEGHPARDTYEIDAPLRLVERRKVFIEPHPEGAHASTSVRVLKRGRFRDGSGVALVEARPHTGRQHQIRVHLQSIGHSVVGDKMYGDDWARFLRFCDDALTEDDVRVLRLHRQALHAWRLALPHPSTGARVELVAPLAPDLQRFADRDITWD